MTISLESGILHPMILHHQDNSTNKPSVVKIRALIYHIIFATEIVISLGIHIIDIFSLFH